MYVIFGLMRCSAAPNQPNYGTLDGNIAKPRMFKNWARPREFNESIYGNRERRMRRSAVRLLSLMVTAIFLSAPALSAFAAGGGDPPSPPPSSSDSSKTKK